VIGVDPELVRFAVHLEEVDIPCMVASAAYGEARSTLDIDLVLSAGPEDAERIFSAFPRDSYYVPPVEVIRRELQRGRKGTFNIIHPDTSLKADLYPMGSDEVNQMGMRNRRPIHILTVGTMHVAPPECVIIGKLRYFSMSQQPKHLRDIRGMLAVVGAELDRSLIGHWARVAGVEAEWHDCQARPGAE
jgi:hypothetical protein